MKTATEDKYGTVYREALKRSMSEPYHPTNRREPRTVPAWTLGAVMAGLLVLGYGAVHLFNYIESFFR